MRVISRILTHRENITQGRKHFGFGSRIENALLIFKNAQRKI